MWKIYVVKEFVTWKKYGKMNFDFTKSEYLHICEEAMLSDLQKQLLEDKIKGLTMVQMSMKHNISPETVKREMKKIKKRILKVI